MATLKELNKIARTRRRIIRKAEERLRTRLRRLEGSFNALIIQDFFRKVRTDKNGRILVSANNRQLLNINKRMRRMVSAKIKVELNNLINRELKRIRKINDRYFKALNASPTVRAGVRKKHDRLKAKFKRNIVESIAINNNVSELLRRGVRNGQPLNELKTSTRTLVKGGDQLGVLSHSVWEKDGFEQFEVHSRTVQEAYANSLDLDYAIYQGGEIKTTREFCDEHNGNVYSRLEIARLGQQDWKGKKVGNNVFVDCGGYNCRHEWQWITKQLAARLRDDIE